MTASPPIPSSTCTSSAILNKVKCDYPKSKLGKISRFAFSPIVPLEQYPGPRGFLLFFIGKFCDANRFLDFFIGTKRWEPRKESLCSRLLGTSLSCHQLLTVVSDWRTFLIALWVIWLDRLNIFGDGSGVYMFTFMGMCGELLLYQRILLPGKAKAFVVELAYNSMML